ncbi:unnamed protein product [Nyctereutes procyonoides]|uniref:7-methylguanosine nucleotidase n=1 Tax=Nyctereutes procyonoides TaxID=34880 RepID=A0A811XTJ4_NYCPR|nr:unnamed protein product [Nyctereutes procyonoides]
MVREDTVASTSMCVPVAGMGLAQHIFTLKRNMRQKPKIIEMPFTSNSIREEIICSLIQEGPATFQIVIDFNTTLSRFSYKGKRCPTCHNIDNYKLVTDRGQSYCIQVKEKDYAIKIDPFPTIEEKYPKSQGLLVEQALPEAKLKETVAESDVCSGKDTRMFIPQARVDHPNVRVMTNFVDFDEKGVVKELLQKKYMDSYDIILVKDESLEVANTVLQKIL